MFPRDYKTNLMRRKPPTGGNSRSILSAKKSISTKITKNGVIRLARLQPSTNIDAGIQCSLIHKSLEDCDHDLTEHYVALSYVWGDATDTRQVQVEEKTITITASLDLALRHIRDRRRTILVWADGLCINQNDVEDRNQQVPLMGGIYSIARHTIIFLGPSSKETDFVLQSCQSDNAPAPSSLHLLESEIDSSSVTSFESLAEHFVLSNKWFGRIWILQELVLSVDPWLQCGVLRVRWDRFCTHLEPKLVETKMHTPNNRVLLESMNAIRQQFIQDRNKWQKDNSSNEWIDPRAPQFTLLDPLFTLLTKRRGLGVTDPRDMIYAHLGLLNANVHLVVDYSKSTAQVYEDLAILSLRVKVNLDVLGHVEITELEYRDRSLPSWVPDWKSSSVSAPETPRYQSLSFAISTCVPHVLGIIGWARGSVKSFIHQSDYSELIPELLVLADADTNVQDQSDEHRWSEGQRIEYTKQEKMLKWMSRPQGEKTLEFILDSYATMVSRFQDPKSCINLACVFFFDNWIFPAYGEYLMTLTRGRLSAIIPLEPDHMNRCEGAVCHHVFQQLEHMCLHDGKTQIAILDTGEIVEVPLLAHIGDTMVTLQHWKHDVILRPSPISSSNEEKAMIAQDLQSGKLDALDYSARLVGNSPPLFDWGTFSSSDIRDWNLVQYSGEIDPNGRNLPNTALELLRESSTSLSLRPSVFAIR